MSGPAPKRSEERRRQNKVKVDRAPNRAATYGPPPAVWVEGLARGWFESLRTSGQAVYYTASDWSVALIVARAIMVFEAKPSAFMFGQIMSAMRPLAATEGDRRSLRIELERSEIVDEDEVAAVSALEVYRSRKHEQQPPAG